MLAVMVRFTLAALRCWRTKLQLAVLMLLASWLKGSGADVSFSNEVAKWPRSTFSHMLKSFGNVASGLYFALPLPLLAGGLGVGAAVSVGRAGCQRHPAGRAAATGPGGPVPGARRAGGPPAPPPGRPRPRGERGGSGRVQRALRHDQLRLLDDDGR